MATPTLTAQRLREAARKTDEINDTLDAANRAGLFDLIGFDLPYLADQFNAAADRLEP